MATQPTATPNNNTPVVVDEDEQIGIAEELELPVDMMMGAGVSMGIMGLDDDDDENDDDYDDNQQRGGYNNRGRGRGPNNNNNNNRRQNNNNRNNNNNNNRGKQNQQNQQQGQGGPTSSGPFIPEVVKNFIFYFHRNILDREVYELHSIYENSFNKLTEKFFQKQRWPEAEEVAPLVDNDPVFLVLYRELYYRHVYSKLQPSIEDRINSYGNYCDLFNYILNSSNEPVELELPNQWLWDIIDEFIYQFQSFCQWRSKLKNKSEEEMETLKSRPDVWNVHNVLNVLYSLIQRSRINEQLHVAKSGGDMASAAGEFGAKPLYRMLGYFSIIGLLRVHVLLGDYHLALSTMANIELNKKGLFARVTACHVTTYYYVGFAYMMMRRYSDAIKAFAHILLFIQRTKQYHTRSYQYDAIMKKSDQMYALLAMCVALSPQRVEENVHNVLREKYGDHMNRITRGSSEDALAVFEELFHKSCPKFVSPVAPNFEASGPKLNTHIEPTKHQYFVFSRDVAQQLLVPNIRSFLKLYTTLGVDKLAKLLDFNARTASEGTKKEENATPAAASPVAAASASATPAAATPAPKPLTQAETEAETRRQLMVFKHKTRQRKWESGDVLDGSWGMTSDLDFVMVKDMIYISETKVARKVGEWFVRNINKFEDMVGNLEMKRVKAANAAAAAAIVPAVAAKK